jgi:glycine oxidase
MSITLHQEWADQLRAETGIDNEFYRGGAIFVAREEVTKVEMAKSLVEWKAQGIAHTPLTLAGISELEPHVQLDSPMHEAYLLPDEYQMRNPRHLKALLAACGERGVEITANAPLEEFITEGERVVGARTPLGDFRAKNFCLTAGAWSGKIAEHLGFRLPVKPRKGQIVLLKPERPVLKRIYYENPRYMVPRRDGRIMVGSTVEDVGFDRRVTSGVFEWLLAFAHSVLPALKEAEVETFWAGLRPGNGDGYPYMGRAPQWENLFVSTGHFRAGLHLSPAAAVVMAELIRGQTPRVDLSPFRIDR